METETAAATENLELVFARAGALGYAYAIDIDSGRDFEYSADEPVVTASVFKIFILLELAFEVSEGSLKWTDRIELPPEGRSEGPVGLSVMRDWTNMSVRDLTYLMMAVSDNHATDVLLDLTGMAAVQRRLRNIGLKTSQIVSSCRDIYTSFYEATGVGSQDEFARDPDRFTALLRTDRNLDPKTANSTTPREIAELLRRVWLDEIGGAEVSGFIRDGLSRQFSVARIPSGFDEPGLKFWGKTGTVTHVANEAGVIEWPDGQRVAMGIFLRLQRPQLRNPAADRAIGEAAHILASVLRNAAS